MAAHDSTLGPENKIITQLVAEAIVLIPITGRDMAGYGAYVTAVHEAGAASPGMFYMGHFH